MEIRISAKKFTEGHCNTHSSDANHRFYSNIINRLILHHFDLF